MKRIFLYLFTLCYLQMVSMGVFSQSVQTIFYKVKDGLPSNSIYKTVIDKNGFLWIATDMGLARFDGKNFRNYSTSDGLKDNDITNIFIDSSGTVWAIPFRRRPCYYNPVTDKFDNEETNQQLALIDIENNNPNLLKSGDIMFTNLYQKFFIYHTFLDAPVKHPLNGMPKETYKIIEFQKGKFLFFSIDTIRSFNNGIFETKLPFNKKIIEIINRDNKVYVASANSISIFQFDVDGNIKLLAEKKYPFEIRIFCNTGRRFSVTSLNATTYMLDSSNLEPEEIVAATEGMSVRNVMEDNDNNIWLATVDKGLVKVQQKRITSIDIPILKQNFNALIKTNNILAGNNNGEIYMFDGLYVIKLPLNKDKNIDSWIRKMITTKYGIYVAAQSGSCIIDEKTFRIKKALTPSFRSSKAAAFLNDSMLLLGGHANTYQYNIKTNQITDSIKKRVVSLGKDLSGNIYIGSTDGLFRWKEKKLLPIGEKRKGFSYKVNAIACSPDSLLWVGLGADSLMVIKNNQFVASISLGGLIPGNICKSIGTYKKGEVWLGTNKGLNRISYQYINNMFTYTNTYFGTADGLIGEQVNDIIIQDSIVYVATNEGISYMPANLQLPVSDIATFITGVSINNKPAPLNKIYQLAYDENDITINFSGVDLTGFMPFYEYSINNGNWQPTEKIELKKLASGNYKIKIRAVKRDGKPSTKLALLTVKIATPLWKNSFLWFLTVLLIFTAALYFQQWRNKQKQNIIIEKITTQKRFIELEMQALKAQINPHFIFNCLNSIKGFIYDKDYLQADKYLDRFADLMRSTVDNSDAAVISLKEEITYLDNYLQLEKLRFAEKFDYQINDDTFGDKEKIFIPSMLLQPYVENAIRHGMRYLQHKKGTIIISAKTANDFLICTIDDDGIGRKTAALFKSKQPIEYQSRGMSISKKRAALYGIEQSIIDKEDDNGHALGTTVILNIPLKIKS